MSDLEDIGYEVAQDVLRQTVVEAGGFEGVFRDLRDNWTENFPRYSFLLETSTTREQRIANLVHSESTPSNESLEDIVLKTANNNGIPEEHAVAYCLAAVITRRAGLMEE